MNWEWYAIVITLLLLDANMILPADVLGHVRATLCLSVAKSMFEVGSLTVFKCKSPDRSLGFIAVATNLIKP